MTPTLAERAMHDLAAERVALPTDFEAWQKRAGARGDRPQHRSQVARVTSQLSELLREALEQTVLGSKPPTLSLAAIERPRRVIAIVNAIWNFFRDKLTQRDTSRYAQHLGTADDLAWECYRPFLQAKVLATTQRRRRQRRRCALA